MGSPGRINKNNKKHEEESSDSSLFKFDTQKYPKKWDQIILKEGRWFTFRKAFKETRPQFSHRIHVWHIHLHLP